MFCHRTILAERRDWRLAITRERKEELVAQYIELLKNSSGFVITEYRGMNMGEFNDLRKKLKELGGSYIVTKNTLFTIALREADWIVPEDLLLGPVATVFANGSMPAVAKLVLEFSKDHEQHFVIKGGVMAGNVFKSSEVEAISKLPTLEELRAQLAGLIVQPASSLVGVINAATADIVNVLQAYVQENSEGEAA
jgi:large subunit ribosomal protein L10